MFKKENEFERKDPGKAGKYYWLTVINWTLPVVIILAGIMVTTQNFARLMEFNEKVVGRPLFIRSDGYRIYNPIVFFFSAIKYSFDDYYMYCFFQAIPSLIIGVIVGILVFLIGKILITAHQKNQHVYGTARWANIKELEKWGLLDEHGVVCGQLGTAKVDYELVESDSGAKKVVLKMRNSFFREYILKKPAKTKPLVCHAGATNTWMIAPTRSGKGVSSIIPTCLNYGVPYWGWSYNRKSIFFKRWNGCLKFLARKKKIIKGRSSMIIFDPKGENFEASAGWRSKFSTVLPFNPMHINDSKGNPIGTVHYNPILEIPDDALEYWRWIDMFGNFFFAEGGEGENAFFYNNARTIFNAVVAHVRFSPITEMSAEEKTFSKILEVFSIAGGEDEDDEDANQDGAGNELINELMNSSHYHDDGRPFPEVDKAIHDLAGQMSNMTSKEKGSVYATVYSEMNKLFMDEHIKEVTSRSDFSVHDFEESLNGITLYLIIPFSDVDRISAFFRLIINFIIKIFARGATNANAQTLSIPCLFLLDEFYNMGKFPEIERNASILAGYGCTFYIVTQSLGQINQLYGEQNSFMDNFKTKIIYAPGEAKYAREISDNLGTRSVLLDNISASGSKYEVGYSSTSRSSQEVQVSLMNPDELMKLELNKAIILNQGMPPYIAKKVVYYEDERFMKKAFLPRPKIDFYYDQCAKLPSNNKYRFRAKDDIEKIKEAIRNTEAVQVKKIISNNFNPFEEIM